jgi:hypothetical protein
MKKTSWRTIALVGMGAMSIAAVPACDGGGGANDTALLPRSQDGSNPEEHLAVQESAGSGDTTKSCFQRSDVRAFVTARNGNWGDWAPCYEAQIKSEGYQGSGDDTAENGFALHCFDGFTAADRGWITSNTQKWGTWGAIADSNPYILDNPWIGALVGFQRSGGDDTAVSKIGMYDRYGALAAPARFPGYAVDFTTDYNSGACPSGTAVCGIRTQIEAVQVGDDTAMNGLQIACCTF